MDEMTISIGDLLAVLARKGKQIICCGIALAILLGGFKGFTMWRNLNDEEYVNLKQTIYEQEKLRLERTIETAKRGISNQEEYIANSLWMNINPYNKHEAEIYLAISGIDESDLTMTFGDTTTPRDYMLERITEQYSVLWSAENLQQSLSLPQYEQIMEIYIREVVSLTFMDGGILRIIATANSEAESRELATAAADLLLNKADTVRKNSFPHTISVLNTLQQNLVDTGMAEQQYAQYAQIDNYNASITSAEKAILELEQPDSLPVAVIKMILIGGILGGGLACAWYICKVFMTGTVQSSAQMERSLAIPFSGTLMKQRDLFHCLAHLFSGERIWKDNSQALDYIVEMVKLRLSGQRLLMVSTLDLAKSAEMVEQLRKVLSSAGIQTEFKDNCLYGAGTTTALSNCDGVLLLEQVDKTKLDKVIEVCHLSEECEKALIGFVLV